MEKNMGATDKVIRVSIAVIIGILYYLGIISGTTAIVLGAFAVIFILTSFISFCPLYMPFRINTVKKNKL
jgi:uncharacterized membrane protein